jgi:putative oxidoreductase
MEHNRRHKEVGKMNTMTAQNPMLPLLSRVLIGALFVVAGSRKAMAIAATAGYFAKLGFPAPEAMAYLAVLIEVGGGIALIIGWQTRWIAWLLAAFVVIATGMAHRFWEFADPAQYGAQLNNFLKNAAIIGGLLLFATFGPGSASVDKR